MKKLAVTINDNPQYLKRLQSNEFPGEWKIVPLKKGWVMVGKIEESISQIPTLHVFIVGKLGPDGSYLKTYSASVVKKWFKDKKLFRQPQ